MTFIASKNYLVAAAQGALTTLSQEERSQFQGTVTQIEELDVGDESKLLLLANRIAELTSVDLLAAFIKQAKLTLAPENQRVREEAENRRNQLLAAGALFSDAKNRKDAETHE